MTALRSSVTDFPEALSQVAWAYPGSVRVHPFGAWMTHDPDQTDGRPISGEH